MSIDLQHSLADLAGSVHDDALATRLTAQVGPMVGRIRRRRAARAAAVGAASMGTVAAMAVGAVALANRDGSPTPGPATQAPQPPVPVPHDGEALECNDAMPDALVSDPALALAGETQTSVPYGSDLSALLRWWAPTDEPVEYAEASVDLAVVRDGLVVGVAESDLQGEPVALSSTETGTQGTFGADLPVTPCGGDTPLDPGSYDVVATVTLTSADGTTWRASTGPWAWAVEAVADDVAAAPVDAEGEAAVQEIVDSAWGRVGLEAFGACGTIVPEIREEDPLALELDLDDGSGMSYSPGDPIDAVTILSTRRSRTVLADVPSTGATVVLVRGGVVVGRAAPVEDETMPVEVTPDGPQPIYGTGSVELCSLPGADAPQVALPTGIYQAYAVMPVTVQEVTEANGEAGTVGAVGAAGGAIVVRSQPVDVIVQRPRG